MLLLMGQAPTPSPSPPAPAAAPSPVVQAPAATPATPSATPSAAAPGQPTDAAQLPSDGALERAFWTALVQELPKLLTAFVVAALAWFVGSRITAAWDVRKKRSEFDMLLAKEFYGLVASFKAVGREWDTHLRSKPAAGAAAMTAWETTRVALAKRALDAETGMESLLLKLVTEGIGGTGTTESERDRRRHQLSLFRVAFRSLRESVEAGQGRPPGWGDPRFWLFNRLAGEISRLVHERAVQVPWRAGSAAAPVDAQDYLGLLAARTTDLHVAARSLGPAVEGFFMARAQDRVRDRKANVARLLRPEATALVDVLPRLPAAPGTAAPLPDLPPTVTAAVEVTGPGRDAARAPETARALFGAHAGVQHYVVLCDQPARVLVFSRGQPVRTFEELDEIGKSTVPLPWQDGARAFGADFLAWTLSDTGRRSIAEMARIDLGP